MMRKLIFRVHAIQKMFERHINRDDVQEAVNNGEIIREYPDDTPFPSRLILCWVDNRPLHVVAADDDNNQIIIITAYEPDATIWESNFKKKKE